MRVGLAALITLGVGIAAVVVAAIAWTTRRERTALGFGQHGQLANQLGRGASVGRAGVALLWAAVVVTGIGAVNGFGGTKGLGTSRGVTVFFVVLFFVEEVAFRGLGTGGLAAFVGLWPATLVVNVLVAMAYASNDATSALAVAGQVLSNLVLGAARVRTGQIWAGLALKVVWSERAAGAARAERRRSRIVGSGRGRRAGHVFDRLRHDEVRSGRL